MTTYLIEGIPNGMAIHRWEDIKRATLSPDAIRTAEDHARALVEIESLWDAELGTSEGYRLEALATLVDAYEQEHFPIPSPEIKGGAAPHLQSGEPKKTP